MVQPRTEFHGTYTNRVWNYSVLIPAGLTGYTSAPPTPQHGFGVVIASKPQGYVLVNGQANSLAYSQASDAAKARLELLRDRGFAIDSRGTKSATLGGLPAVYQEVHYRCGAPAHAYVHVSVIAITEETVYEIALWSARNTLSVARAVFDELVRSWRFLSVLR